MRWCRAPYFSAFSGENVAMVLAPIVALEFLGGKARPRPTGLEAKGDRIQPSGC